MVLAQSAGYRICMGATPIERDMVQKASSDLSGKRRRNPLEGGCMCTHMGQEGEKTCSNATTDDCKKELYFNSSWILLVS